MTEQTSDIQWYIARDGKQYGPLSDAEMQLFVDGGHLQEPDLIWRAGFADWLAAYEIFPPKQTPTAAPIPEPDPEEGPVSLTQNLSRMREKTAAEATASSAKPEDTAKSSPTTSPKAAAPSGGISQTQPQPTNTAPKSNQTSQSSAPAGTADGTPKQAASSNVELQKSSAPSHSPQQVQTPTTQTSTSSPYAYTPTQPDMEPAPSSNRGRRFAIAAVVLAFIGGGGWFALQNNEQLSTFARAALNIPNSGSNTKDATESINVVKAPDSPSGSPPPAETTNAPTTNGPASDISNAFSQEDGRGTNAAGQKPDADRQATTDNQVPFDTAALTPQEQPAASVPDVDAHYTSSPLWTVVRQEFPDWYGERMREIAQLSTEKTQSDVTKYAMRSLVKLRRQHAKEALAASSPKLRNIASAFLQNLQSLKSHSTEACYGFISKGETSPAVTALYDDGDQKAALEAQATAVFQAIADGRQAPKSRERPQKPDYDVLAVQLGQLGWSQADLQLFANPKALARAAPERVCQMVQDWFSAHISIEDEAVQERLLFETLRPVIAG